MHIHGRGRRCGPILSILMVGLPIHITACGCNNTLVQYASEVLDQALFITFP